MAESKTNASAYSVETLNGVDYRYRDVFQAFIGQGELVLEFGNVNRSNPEQITIADRIVLSLPSAVRLNQHLNEQLRRAQERAEAQKSAAK